MARPSSDQTCCELTIRTAAACSLVVGLAFSRAAPAQEAAADQTRLIENMVSAWRARKGDVGTLSCKAKVESFFPKDSLSEKLRFEFKGKSPQFLFPEEDLALSDQTISWDFDFAARRVRIESRLNAPWLLDKTYEFGIDHTLKLFSADRLRFFALSKEGRPKGIGADTLVPDVTLHESASHDFLLYQIDLPLLWLAGGVNGQHPRPSAMQQVDNPETFVFRSRAEWKGKRCAVVTVPEQNSPTALREFWVGIDPPFPIYRCRALWSGMARWQVEAEYADAGARMVLSRWTLTSFNYPGKLFRTTSCIVEKLDLNTPLPAALFEKKLEPGSTVYHTEKNKAFEVDDSGNLIPAGSPRRGWPWPWIVLAVALLCATPVALHFYRKARRNGRFKKG